MPFSSVSQIKFPPESVNATFILKESTSIPGYLDSVGTSVVSTRKVSSPSSILFLPQVIEDEVSSNNCFHINCKFDVSNPRTFCVKSSDEYTVKISEGNSTKISLLFLSKYEV